MKLQIFNQVNFLQALKALFNDLKVPMNYVADEPTTAQEILKDTYKDNDTFQLMDDIYFVGMVDDAAFEGNKSLDAEKIKSDYDGILIFGVTLKNRPNGLLPTRSQLAEISRAFNREFYYTPVVVVFKYGNYLAFANTERLKYKQEWREGEKAGKVSLLRDIHIEKPHSGHERILAELQIPTTGTKKVDSFAKLYAYWQEVFSVSLLNKKFYQELSNWYFWATKHVTFPGEPTIADAHHKKAKLEDLLQEHRATNVIRMLTRLLFVWFIKEKKLIPEELFDLDALQKNILNEISPYHEKGMFKERNKESIYYKAILQNLFFATLNCPIEADSLDKRKRGFRGDGYGTHRGIDYLMRYKQYFKNPDAFLKKLNQTVPFLNGGLFECLDDKFNNIYIDGFSDQMTKGEQLIVPDYLFFGVEEETDLSDIIGIKDKKYKKAAVKGLINILKSYKFTITENTPIEEDVALDPELLGKVFENLLASYNPETKTTARKQTGSFYTPREIVNYMVDESLIAYLKNAIKDWGGLDDETLDKELHVLTSFDSKVPFADNAELQREIITALSTCTILDPACGSGAFPMGILQKMVHILQKLDPENKVWKEVQLEKARKESEAAFEIEDKQARKERLLEINEAFDQSINDPDYARKLFLIENCIYGVDIQPIAVQISKLRFFISLVVEQKPSDKPANNFNIRPLPNLETKFVAANTLIGIKKVGGLFETDEVKKLENELKIVRHKIFSLKSKERKIAWREKDKELREKLSTVLKNQGLPLDAAEKLAGWDPYDQNASSPFFDSEWMFGIKDGFDVMIGNPPYIQLQKMGKEADILQEAGFETFARTGDIYCLFYEKGINLLKAEGNLNYITSNKWLKANYGKSTREFFLKHQPIKIIDLGSGIFKTATVDTNILIIKKLKNSLGNKSVWGLNISNESIIKDINDFKDRWVLIENLSSDSWAILDAEEFEIKKQIENIGKPLNEWKNEIYRGVLTGLNEAFIIENETKEKLCQIDSNNQKIIKPILKGKNIKKYKAKWDGLWLIEAHNGYKKSKGEIIPPIDINDFPRVKEHLDSFEPKLSKRGDKGVTPYNLRNCAYQEEFTKEKIVWADIAREPSFAYLGPNIYFNNTVYFIVGDSLKYLLTVLNSRVIDFYFQKIGTDLGQDGGRYFKQFVELFPIPDIEELYRKPFETLAEYLIYLNDPKQAPVLEKVSNEAVSQVFEDLVNMMVYELYFEEEMKAKEIDVLQFVTEKAFPDITQAEDKKAVIQKVYYELQQKDNPIRNRILVASSRSETIARINAATS